MDRYSVHAFHAGYGLTRSAKKHIGQRWVFHSLDQMVLPACGHSGEHESNRRRTWVSATVRGRDVVIFVAEAQKSVENEVVIPAGYEISAGVGFIALFGVAVLNGLVWVSAAEHLPKQRMPLPEATHETVLSRLRPVLMTALVASPGFLPMPLSTSEGAEMRKILP